MPRLSGLVVLIFYFQVPGITQSTESISEWPEPPKAKKVARYTVFHGDTLLDNYYWLRQKKEADVINYLSAENGYTSRVMKDTEIFQRRLYQEMKDRLPAEDISIPQKIGDYFYYTRRETGKNFSLYCRKKDKNGAQEEVLLDMNQVAEKSSYARLVQLSVSPNQELLAYSVDFVGSGKGSIYIKNLKTGAEIDDEIHETGQFAWASDNQTIFYSAVDSTNRGNKVFQHKIDSPITSDKMVYEERDSTYSVSVYTSLSKKYIFMISASTIATECRYRSVDFTEKKWHLIKKREAGVRYVPEHYTNQNEFVLFYNDSNTAPDYNGAIKTISIDQKNAELKTLVPGHEQKPIESYALFENYLILLYREEGLQKFRVIPKVNGQLNFKASSIIDFPDETYSISIGSNPDYLNKQFRFNYTSFTQPNTTYEYDLETQKLTILKQQKVANYTPTDYTSERIWARAEDGTRIPVSLVYKKGLVKDGSNPLYLNGYGAFGVSENPYFNYQTLSLLDRGIIYAIAHVRGGGEMGYQWHQEGRYLKTINTFTDFISVSEHLISEGYTSSDKLICQGASSGGLLVGAAVTMRPDLYKGAIINVPFLDVINTQSDLSIPVAALESYEWGDPYNKEVYDYMKLYSPYDNIKATDYPNILVQGGYNDINVAFWEAPKFVAKMREHKTDSNMLLLKMNMSGGHGLTSGRYSGIQQAAFEQAFILKTLGIKSDFSRISGIVRDKSGEPMPYVNVVIKNTSNGTTTNYKGEYALELKNGPYSFVFRHVGFEQHEESIELSDNLSLDVTLNTESLLLKTVEIRSDYKDPAYAVIKAAQAKRKDYLNQAESFSAQVYMRADNRFDEIPEKRPFFIPKNEMPDSSDLGLIYLSESEAILHRKKPDNIKEVMISSKIAGNSQGYSWNRAGGQEFNFYKNLILIKGLSERGFVSPIAGNALLFYQYEYIGIKEEKDAFGITILVNKIKVIPRRKNDPVFNGYIYIAEDSWRITAVDLNLEDNQIEVFDKFTLEQNYIAVTDSIWLPLTVKFYVHLSIFGFGISGANIINYSNYELNPDFPPKFFNNEIFKIEKSANQRDTTYWMNNRPVVLTADEISYYRSKQETELKKQSKAYLDSLDRAENKTSWQDLFDGFWYYKRYTQETFSTNALFDMVNFNTVEGLNLDFRFRYRKGRAYDRNIRWVNSFRYGFSNERFNFKSSLFWTMNRQKHQSITIEGGRFITQVNNAEPIYPIINTFYSLAFRENYMKLYGQHFGSFRYKQELSNGIYFNGLLTYEDRQPLVNTTNFSFRDEDVEDGDIYTSNDPTDPLNFDLPFQRHQALMLDLEFKFYIKQKYISRPNGKVPMGSKYPKFTLNYKKGLPVFGSDIDYDFAFANIGDNVDLGLYGKFSYDAGVGKFLNTNEVEFIDHKHFNGNQTIFINFTEPFGQNRAPLDRFQLLDYYTFSTTEGFFEGHIEYHGNGFITNKIPLLRRTKFQAVGGINMLLLQGNREHYEFSVGLENILKAFRVDFVTGYNSDEDFKGAIRLRLGLNGL
ncbi:MAG: DUF5686 family protein [Bacteroidota bacterium]